MSPVGQATAKADPVPGLRADLPIGLAQMAVGFLVASYGPYLVLLSQALERPREQLVWISSTFGVGLIIAALVGPKVIRAGTGRVLRITAATLAGGVVAMAVGEQLPVAGAGSVLVGLGCASVVLLTPAMIQGPASARRLSRVIAASSTAAISAPLSISLLEHLGVPGRWALLVPLPALLFLVFRGASDVTVSPAPTASPTRRPPILAAAVGWIRMVLAVSVEFCFVIWGVARLQDTGVATATAAALSAAFGIGMAVGRLALPRVAERRWIVPVGCALAMTGTGIVFVGQQSWLVTAGIATASLGIAALYPVTLAQLVAVPGLRPRHSAPLGALASGVAILFAPTVLAWIDGGFSLRTAFLLPIPLLLLLLALPSRHHNGVKS